MHLGGWTAIARQCADARKQKVSQLGENNDVTGRAERTQTIGAFTQCSANLGYLRHVYALHMLAKPHKT
jgi:hypothetical protein